MSAGQAWNNARRVLLVDVNNNALVTQPGNADDQPATDRGLVVNSRLHLFDGTNWDRLRGNVEGTLLASAARTANTTSPTQANYNARGAIFWLDVTANPGGAETLTLFPREINPVTGVPGSAFTSVAAVAATNGLYVLEMYPGVVNGGTNPKSSSYVLPRTWAVTVTHSGAGSWTYSVGYSLIV